MRIHLTNSRERLRMAQEAAQQKAKADASAAGAADAAVPSTDGASSH